MNASIPMKGEKKGPKITNTNNKALPTMNLPTMHHEFEVILSLKRITIFLVLQQSWVNPKHWKLCIRCIKGYFIIVDYKV